METKGIDKSRNAQHELYLTMIPSKRYVYQIVHNAININIVYTTF